jgi:UTP--glucose-1-phosphate uridylyltransferase
MLPDDLMAVDSTLLGDMVAAHERTGASVVAVKKFGPSEIGSYGVVDPAGDTRSDGLVPVRSMVEKPKAADAPSDLAIMGRYLLTPAIFECIDMLRPGAGGELQLTDAMVMLLERESIMALPFDSGRYDLGNKLDWLRSTVEVALRHPELGADFREVLADLVREHGIA